MLLGWVWGFFLLLRMLLVGVVGTVVFVQWRGKQWSKTGPRPASSVPATFLILQFPASKVQVLRERSNSSNFGTRNAFCGPHSSLQPPHNNGTLKPEAWARRASVEYWYTDIDINIKYIRQDISRQLGLESCSNNDSTPSPDSCRQTKLGLGT